MIKLSEIIKEWKTIDVNKNNYKKYKYLNDYRHGALESLTDEEIKAQLYHISDVYRGIGGPLKRLKSIAEKSIKQEMGERGIK